MGSPQHRAWQVAALRDENFLLTFVVPAVLVVYPLSVLLAVTLWSGAAVVVNLLLLLAPSAVRRLARRSLLRHFAAGKRLELAEHLLRPSTSSLKGSFQLRRVMQMLRIGVEHGAFEVLADHFRADDVESLLEILESSEKLPGPQVQLLVGKIYQSLVSGAPGAVAWSYTAFSQVLRLRSRHDLDDKTAFLLARLTTKRDLEELFTTPASRGGIRPGEAARLAVALTTHPLVGSGGGAFLSEADAAAFTRRTLTSGVLTQLLPRNPDTPSGPERSASRHGEEEVVSFLRTVIENAPVHLWYTHLVFGHDDPVRKAYAAERPLLRDARQTIAGTITAPCLSCGDKDEEHAEALLRVAEVFAPEWDLDLGALSRLAHRLVCNEKIDPAVLET